LPEYLNIFITAVVVVGVVLSCMFIIYERNSPSATLAWLLAMIFLPFVGLAAYFTFGRRRVRMRLGLLRAIREHVGDIRHKLAFDRSLMAVLKATDDGVRRHDLMLLAYRYPGLPPTLGNRMEVLKNAEEAYPAILESIESAEKYVHLLYYIFKPDSAGSSVMEALAKKASEGVEVRLLYDDIGSSELGPEFFRPLLDAGGMVFPYRPVYFSRFRTFYANFRNHRKIMVVDGRTAYTGGINIGDEYLGKDPAIGFWRDTNIRLTGQSASHLQLVFAEDWYYVTNELLGPDYVADFDEPAPGGGIVQIVPSGPDRAREQVAQVYFTAITSAKNTLYITTPYFIPDEAVQTALIAAALRGVDVRLLVPHKSDTKTVTYASRSYYRELLSAGCRIYEYKKGFVHAKTMTVDGELGIVGTANMDIRSFKLNFEVCAVCYDDDVAETLVEHFVADQKDAEQVRLATFSKRPRVDKFLENTARLLSSLL